MDIANRIAFLEARLNRLLSRHEKDNEGVCRKIRREIRNLKSSWGSHSTFSYGENVINAAAIHRFVVTGQYITFSRSLERFTQAPRFPE